MILAGRGKACVEYIVNGISGLAEGGYGPLVNTGKHDAFKSYYTRFNTFSLLPVSFFYINASKHHRKSLSTACFCLAAVFFLAR